MIRTFLPIKSVLLASVFTVTLTNASAETDETAKTEPDTASEENRVQILPGHKSIVQARIHREFGEYEQALAELQTIDLSSLPQPLIEKLQLEMDALRKLIAGWRLPHGDEFEFRLSAVDLYTRTGQYEIAHRDLERTIKDNPDRWEAFATKARLLALEGASAAEITASLDAAVEMGGQPAQLAVKALRSHVEQMAQTQQSAEVAEKLAKSSKYTDAAAKLESSWLNSPKHVEFAIQAVQYRVKTKDYTTAAQLAKKAAEYLKENPANPAADKGPTLALTAIQCERAAELRKKLTRPTTTKSSKTSSSKTAKPETKKSMSGKFLQRTGN